MSAASSSPYSSPTKKSTPSTHSKQQTQPQWSTTLPTPLQFELLLPHPDPRKFTRKPSTQTLSRGASSASASTVNSRLTTFTSTSKSSVASQSSSLSTASFGSAVGAGVKVRASVFGVGVKRAKNPDKDGTGVSASVVLSPASWKKRNAKGKGKGKGKDNGEASVSAGFGVPNSPPRLGPLAFGIGSGKLDLDADAFVYPIYDDDDDYASDLSHPSPSSASPASSNCYHNDNYKRNGDCNRDGNRAPEINFYTKDDDDDEADDDNEAEDNFNSNIRINYTNDDDPLSEHGPPARLIRTHRSTESSSTITPSTYTRRKNRHHQHHRQKQHELPQRSEESSPSSSPISGRKLEKQKRLPPPTPLVLQPSSSSSEPLRTQHHPDRPIQAGWSGSLSPNNISPRSAGAESSSSGATGTETETGSLFVVVTPPTPLTPITANTSNDNSPSDDAAMQLKSHHDPPQSDQAFPEHAIGDTPSPSSVLPGSHPNTFASLSSASSCQCSGTDLKLTSLIAAGPGSGVHAHSHAPAAPSPAPAHASRPCPDHLRGENGGCSGPMTTIDIDEPVVLTVAGRQAAAVSSGGGDIYRGDESGVVLDHESEGTHNDNDMVCRKTKGHDVKEKRFQKAEKKNTSEVELEAAQGEGTPSSSSSSSASTSTSTTSSSLTSPSSEPGKSDLSPQQASTSPNMTSTASSSVADLEDQFLPLPHRTASPVLNSTTLSRSGSVSSLFAKSTWRKWTAGLGERRMSASMSAPLATLSASADRDVKGKGKEKEKSAEEGVSFEQNDKDEEQNNKKRKRESSFSMIISSSKKHGHGRSMSDSTFRVKFSPRQGGDIENPLSASAATTATAMGKPKPKFTLGCESDVDLPLHRASPLESGSAPGVRPPFLRKNAGVVPLTSSSEEGTVRAAKSWTLASAIIDEAISDEVLIKELERMREMGEWELSRRRRKRMKRGEGDNVDGEIDGVKIDENQDEDEGGDQEEDGVVSGFVWGMDKEIWDGPSSSPHSAQSPSPSPNPTTPTSWLAAQRALLICRELILTERNYLTHLETLLAAQTQTAPPPLMLHYAAELVSASRGVLSMMENAPSVRGVASAFLEREEVVCAAYVRWCGVVGGWFVDLQQQQEEIIQGRYNLRKKKSRVRMVAQSEAHVGGGGGEGDNITDDGHLSTCSSSAHGHPAVMTMSSVGAPSHPPLSPLKRTVSTWRRSMPTITSLGLDGGMMSIYARREREKEKERDDGTGSTSVFVRSSSPLSGPSTSSPGPGRTGLAPERDRDSPAKVPQSVAEQGLGKRASIRKPLAVRELAILPTQRVMRYVLLYRDLLTHTPHTSASRVIVERALEAASRIAEMCDRAQGNAAFIQSSNVPSSDQNGHGKENESESASSSRRSSRRDVKVKDNENENDPAVPAGDDDAIVTMSPTGLSDTTTDICTSTSLSPTTSSNSNVTSTSSPTSSSSLYSSALSARISTSPSSSSPSNSPMKNKAKRVVSERPASADSALSPLPPVSPSRRMSLMSSVTGFGAIAGGWTRLGNAQTSQRQE